MDLETENRLAALLMEEARRLRAQAEKDGVYAYLHEPNVRSRPNSRFLAATVLGVEQANRATEINEMWRAREKELELDSKLRREKHKKNAGDSLLPEYRSKYERLGKGISLSCSSSKHKHSSSMDDNGLGDEEVEEFLHSRTKRGRGSIGSRMDEPGPGPCSSFIESADVRLKEDWEHHLIGPQQQPITGYGVLDHDTSKIVKDGDRCSKKHHSGSKKKSKDREGRRKEKRSKHHSRSERR